MDSNLAAPQSLAQPGFAIAIDAVHLKGDLAGLGDT